MKPFVLAVCHGKGEPKVQPFFCDLRKELNRLNKSTILPENEMRGVTVAVRAWIGDAPARCWMCGTKGVTGFLSCPRCKIVGVHPEKTTKSAVDDTEITESTTGVKFPFIRQEKRMFEEWGEYFNMYPVGETNPNRVHRTGPTPLDQIIGVNPINDVPLEEMHLMDLGVLKDTPELLLRLELKKKKSQVDPRPPPKKRRRRGKNAAVDGSKKKTLSKITPLKYRSWNYRIRAWSKLTPREFARRCRTLESYSNWKATEHRQFFYYYMPALMYVDEKNFGGAKRDAVLHINYGMSLLKGNNHHKSVPDVLINRSEHHLEEGFLTMVDLTDGANASFKGHAFVHLGDDVRYFKCRLGSLSSYPYENQMIFFRHMGLQGTRVIHQIKNRLLEKGHLHDDLDDCGRNRDDEESIESFHAKLLRNKASRPNMDLSAVFLFPPFFVHSFNERYKIIHCELFTITEQFPDNVVRLHFEGKTRCKRNAYCIEQIIRDELGRLFVTVREFSNIANSFSNPFSSEKIGNFVAWGGLKVDSETIPFSRVIGKYFSFPLFLDSKNSNDEYHPSQLNQRWILQEIARGEF
jgi:hypothetical protein